MADLEEFSRAKRLSDQPEAEAALDEVYTFIQRLAAKIYDLEVRIEELEGSP